MCVENTGCISVHSLLKWRMFSERLQFKLLNPLFIKVQVILSQLIVVVAILPAQGTEYESSPTIQKDWALFALSSLIFRLLGNRGVVMFGWIIMSETHYCTCCRRQQEVHLASCFGSLKGKCPPCKFIVTNDCTALMQHQYGIELLVCSSRKGTGWKYQCL